MDFAFIAVMIVMGWFLNRSLTIGIVVLMLILLLAPELYAVIAFFMIAYALLETKS